MANNSGVNTGFAKCFILFMAVVIFLQGAVYLGLSIWGITLKSCDDETTDISAKPFQFAMDLIYFANVDCGNPSITIPELGSQAIAIPMTWSTSEIVTDRMNAFMITYIVVSALWVVTSLLVMATLCGPVTKTVLAICFWPWFLIVIAGSILDAVATGFHIHDIVHTTTAEETFDYVGALIPSDVINYIDNFSAYFVTPAIVMTCISSRVVLIWLLNIFGTSFCLSLSRVLSSRSKQPVPIEPRAQEFVAATTVTASLDSRPQVVVTAQQSQPPQQMVMAEQYPQQIRPKPLPIAVAAQPIQRQQSERPVQSPTTTVYPPLPSAPSPEANQQAANDMITYRSTESHPDRLDYPAPTSASPTAHLSAVSPLNNRYSVPAANESAAYAYPNRESQQPQRVSEELRGQLPWSYTSVLGSKPQPPRKPQPQVQTYPQIPEPDYIEQDASNAHQSYSRW